jgi:hypothetical protein
MKAKKESPEPLALSWREIGAVVLLGAAFLCLYLATLDLRANFDALISAAWAESWRPRHGLEKLFAWNHFLFNAAGWGLFWLFRPWHLSGYRTLQILNAALAAGTVSILFAFLLSRTRRLAWSAGWAALLGVSQAFWRQGVGGEAYTSGAFFVLLAVVACSAYARAPGLRAAVRAAACAGAAALFHSGNLAACLPVLFALRLKSRAAPALRHGLAVAGTWAALAAPYLWVHRIFSPAAARRWFAVSSYAQRPFEGLQGPHSWRLDVGAASQALRSSLLSLESGRAAFAGLAALLAMAWWRGRPWFDPARRALKEDAALFAAAFCAYFALYSAWQPGNDVYWCAIVPLLLAFLGTAGPAEPPALRAAALWASVGLAASVNLAYTILPNREMGNFPTLSFASSLSRLTPPNAVILISGLWSDLKVHIPAFSRRKRLALELYLLGGPKEQALRSLAVELDRLRRSGTPVYTLSEFWDEQVLAELKKVWGVERSDLDALLRPYRAVRVQRFQVPHPRLRAQDLSLLVPVPAGSEDEKRLLGALESGGFKAHARRARAQSRSAKSL